MYKNTKILIFFITIVLLSGCININVTPSGQSTATAIPSYTKTPKNIDASKLDIKKVVLDDNEIKDIIGPEWIKQNNPIMTPPDNIQMTGSAYEQQNTYYKIPPATSIMLYILPNTTVTDDLYNKILTELFKKTTTTDYEIGESGKLIKGNDSTGTIEVNAVVFKINTIVVMTVSTLDQDTAIKLASKQEAKIARILETIK